MLENILNAAFSQSKLNIATFPTHERYASGLDRTGHKFYMVQGPGIKSWYKQYGEIPPNHILLPPRYKIPSYVDLQCVLSQNKAAHWNIATEIANRAHIPIISLEHCLPIGLTKEHLANYKNANGYVNVFISEYSREKWGYTDKEGVVIHHGINTDLFQPADIEKKNYILSICNDWINRDVPCGYKLWAQTVGFPNPFFPIKVLGDTPGLSKPAASMDELIQSYQECSVFLNTSLQSPIPSVLLEAAACGCAIVSTSNCMIPEFFTHKKNALLGNTPDDLRKHCHTLLNDKDMRIELGKNARKTVLEHFSLTDFIKNWNKVFNMI